MESYDKIEEEKASVASESQVAYGNTQPTMPLSYHSMNGIPEGYMSLEHFGELFHQKLDACYA